MKNEEFLSKKRAIELWDKNIIKTFMWGLLKATRNSQVFISRCF